MEREDPRNADRPAGNILAPSYLLPLSCRISAVQHIAQLSFSSPFSSPPRRGLFRETLSRFEHPATGRKLLHSKTETMK